MGARLLISLFTVLVVGCGETNTQPQLERLVVKAVPNASVVAYLASFKSGVGAVAAIDDGKIVELFPTSSDTVLRRTAAGRGFFVIDRHGGAIYRHELAATTLTREPIYRDRGANFQDVSELGDGTFWVSALNREAVVRVDASGKVVDTVLLKDLAAPEAKGFAYPTYFWSNAGKTYLLVQRLKDGVRPSDKSYVIELAPGVGIVCEPHPLAKTNPYPDWTPFGERCALVGESGEIGAFSKLDGAIERFCPADANPWTVVATEEELKSDIYDFVVLSEKRLLCLSASPKNEIFVFDLRRRVAEKPIESLKGFRYVDLISDGGGNAYVADRDETNAGIRKIDVNARTLSPALRTLLEPLSLLWMW